MAPNRHLRVPALLAFVLIGVLLFQFADLDDSHDSNHARHCCAACHAGHITALADAPSPAVIPPSDTHRYDGIELAQRAAGRSVVSTSSRAPPA